MYLCGAVIILYIVIWAASFERVVIEEPRELEREILVEVPMENIPVQRNLWIRWLV